MANEITVSLQLSVEKGYLSDSQNHDIQVDFAGTASSKAVQNIGTTEEQVVLPAEIATGGYAYFRNLDSTNYVEIGVKPAATFYPLIKLKKGQIACLPLATVTFYAKANTAAVNLLSFVLDN